MARKRANGETEKIERKQKKFKNQGFKMRGNVTNLDCFGKNEEHAWYVLEDDISGIKYCFKHFNISDEMYNILCDSKKAEVYFNICYNNYKNNLQLQLVSTEIHSSD